jgi:hypothetical protein
VFFLSNSARINLGFSLSDCIDNFSLIYQSAVTELQVLLKCDRNCVGGVFPLSQQCCWFVCVYFEVVFLISKYHGYFVLFELPSNAAVLGEFQVIGFFLHATETFTLVCNSN